MKPSFNLTAIASKSAVILLLLINATLSQATEWVVQNRQPIYQTDQNSPVVGYEWILAAEEQQTLLGFRLRTDSTMSQGEWMGWIRAKPRVNSAEITAKTASFRSANFKIDRLVALGNDANNGAWTNAQAKDSVHDVIFSFEFDAIHALIDAVSLELTFSTVENPSPATVVYRTIDSKSYEDGVKAMIADIKQMEGGNKWVMTHAEIGSTPIRELPPALQSHLEAEIAKQNATEKLGLPLESLREKTPNQLRDMLKKAEYQKIYDQWPNWDDLNICPDGNAQYCANVGKIAYDIKPVFIGMDAFRYGRINGVVWRSKGAVIDLRPGVVELNIEPEITYADEAGYYYIAQDAGEELHIVAVDNIEVKSN